MKFLRFGKELIPVTEIVRISASCNEETKKDKPIYKPAAFIYMRGGEQIKVPVKLGICEIDEFDTIDQAISAAAYRLECVLDTP